MFEECFSMLELDSIPAAQGPADAEKAAEPNFDDLSVMLVSVLDEVLSDLEEGLASFH